MRSKRYTLRLDLNLSDRLKAVKERLGVSEAEQIRRGIALWLESIDWPLRRRRQRRPPDDFSGPEGE